MHELSIAENIIEIVEQTVKKEHCTAVNEIEIEVGDMSGVIIEALEFAMDVAVENTPLKNARVKIIRIPGVARCRKCNKEFDIKDYTDTCPYCNNYDIEIIKGKELRVKTIKAE